MPPQAAIASCRLLSACTCTDMLPVFPGATPAVPLPHLRLCPTPCSLCSQASDRSAAALCKRQVLAFDVQAECEVALEAGDTSSLVDLLQAAI